MKTRAEELRAIQQALVAYVEAVGTAPLSSALREECVKHIKEELTNIDEAVTQFSSKRARSEYRQRLRIIEILLTRSLNIELHRDDFLGEVRLALFHVAQLQGMERAGITLQQPAQQPQLTS